MKLYRVTCKGIGAGLGCNVDNRIGYVIAEDSGHAYARMREYLNDNKIGFKREREMEKVELIAEDATYPDCGYRLYV